MIKGKGRLWEENREASALDRVTRRVSDKRWIEKHLLDVTRGMSVVPFREQFI